MILVGEMRDLETISTALTAAETGHLVFATLHTQDAPQSIDRVIDVFPAHQQQQVRVQLASALQGICTQQLVPTARRSEPRDRVRGDGRDARGPQPHPGGQDAPDLLDAPGRWTLRDGHDGHVARATRAQRAHLPGHGARTLRQRRRLPPPLERLIDRMTETFAYKVRDKSGKLVEGQLEAENAQLVVSKLRSMGYVPIEIEQQGEAEPQQGSQDPVLLGPDQAEGRRRSSRVSSRR